VLLALLLATAVTIVRLRNMFAVVVLGGIYSFLMAITFTVLDAVDVAFTEAAVGAGVTTVLALAALSLTTYRERQPAHRPWLPAIVVIVTGLVLIYAIPDMPAFGDPSAPIHGHVAPRYIEETPEAIGIPNIVTAVLADYRGYDTLGETFVIFTAGIGVLLLLARGRRKDGKKA
jgi:multicomponent Na+:H+ antiporter subunit B